MNGHSDDSSAEVPHPRCIAFPACRRQFAKDYVAFSREFSADVKRIAVQYPGPASIVLGLPESIPTLKLTKSAMMKSSARTTISVFFLGTVWAEWLAFEVRCDTNRRAIESWHFAGSLSTGSYQAGAAPRSDREMLDLFTRMTGMNPDSLPTTNFVGALPTLRAVRAIAGYSCPPETPVSDLCLYRRR